MDIRANVEDLMVDSQFAHVCLLACHGQVIFFELFLVVFPELNGSGSLAFGNLLGILGILISEIILEHALACAS